MKQKDLTKTFVMISKGKPFGFHGLAFYLTLKFEAEVSIKTVGLE